MKILGTYIMLLGWLSFMSFFWFGIPDHRVSVQKEINACHVDQKANASNKTNTCCSKFHGSKKTMSANKKSSNHSENTNDCCKSQNCSQTCCHAFVWNVTNDEPIDFSIFPNCILLGSSLNKQPCKPYLGIISPPPNFS